MVKKKPKSTIVATIKKNHLYIIGSIALGIIIGLVAVLVTTQQPKLTVASVGQSVVTEDASLKIKSVTEVAARELFSGQEIEGEKGLIVQLEVTNRTDETRAFIPVAQVYLKSADGKLYQMKPIVGVKNPIKAGEIATGSTVTGDISFMVDKDALDLQLILDTRWNDSLPLVTRL